MAKEFTRGKEFTHTHTHTHKGFTSIRILMSIIATMVFRLRPFKELENGEISGFYGWTEIQLRSNHNDVKINVIIINIQKKSIKMVKLTKFY